MRNENEIKKSEKKKKKKKKKKKCRSPSEDGVEVVRVEE